MTELAIPLVLFPAVVAGDAWIRFGTRAGGELVAPAAETGAPERLRAARAGATRPGA